MTDFCDFDMHSLYSQSNLPKVQFYNSQWHCDHGAGFLTGFSDNAMAISGTVSFQCSLRQAIVLQSDCLRLC